MLLPATVGGPAFHWRCVHVGVGAEKLGGGSRSNRRPTAMSSSTVSHRPAMASSHARLRYQLWICRLGILVANLSYPDSVQSFCRCENPKMHVDDYGFFPFQPAALTFHAVLPRASKTVSAWTCVSRSQMQRAHVHAGSPTAPWPRYACARCTC